MVYVRVQLALLQTSRASPLKHALLQKMRAKVVPAIGRGFMGGLGLRPRPPPPVYTFFCRFCGKGYVNVYSCRRHEKDAHGPRMKCSHCYKFTCPESRVSEMRNHLIEVHGVEAGPPPAKRTRRIWDVPEPTIRVPPSPMPSISMGHQATVDLDDLGADPDVSVEPADYLPSYGPGGVPPSQTLSIPSYTLSKSSSVTLSSEPSTSTSVPLPFALSDSLQDEVSLFDEFFLDGDIPSFEAALPSELTFDPSVATSESCPLSSSEDSAVPSSSAIPSYLLSLGTRVPSVGRASSVSVCHASSGLVTSPPPVYIPTPRHLISSSLQGATDVAGCPVSDPLAASYVCDVSPQISRAAIFTTSTDALVTITIPAHPFQTSHAVSLASPLPSAAASPIVSLTCPHPSPVVSLAPPLPSSVASSVVSLASPHPSPVVSLAPPLPSSVASSVVSLASPHPSPVASLASPLPSAVASSVVSLASPHPSPVVSLASPHPSPAATLAPPLPSSVASSVVSLASPHPSPVVSLASPHPSVVSLASPLPSSVASPVVSFASPHPSDTSLASPHPSPVASLVFPLPSVASPVVSFASPHPSGTSLASPVPSVASPVVSFASPHPSDTSLASPHPSPVASLDSPYPSLAPTVESIAAPVVSLVSAAPPLASSPFPGASGVPKSSVQPSSPVVSPISASLCPTPVAQSQVSDFLPLALVSPVISSGAQLPPQVITLIRELYRFARPDSTSRGTQTDAPESPGKDSSTQMIWKLE